MDVINVTEYREMAISALCVVLILFKRINNLLFSNLLLELNTDEQKSSDWKEDQGEVFLKQSFNFICWFWRDGLVLETLVVPSVDSGRFGFQHPLGSSQLSTTPVLEVLVSSPNF